MSNRRDITAETAPRTQGKQLEFPPDASAHPAGELPLCDYCREAFPPVKPWQRFCKDEHRRLFHREKAGVVGSTRGIVSSVRLMKRGFVSIVIRVPPADRAAALAVTPGDVVDIGLVREPG